MTEETSSTPAPSPTQPAPSAPVSTVLSTDLAPILARISSLEEGAKSFIENIAPRLLALEEAVESLAKRAESLLPDSIINELSELKTVVASLGGGITGAPGHDAAAFFHSWWNKITGKSAPAPSASATQAAAGASVTNSGPLAVGGAPTSLSGK